jgi:nucleoid-associated protein YgaU
MADKLSQQHEAARNKAERQSADYARSLEETGSAAASRDRRGKDRKGKMTDQEKLIAALKAVCKVSLRRDGPGSVPATALTDARNEAQ